MRTDDIPATSGIYKLTCTANKRFYIGSAINLRNRKRQHFNDLRRNIRHNPHIQKAWNKYGESAFTFEVLELVLPISLLAREQYWLDNLKPFGRNGFNTAREAGSPIGIKRALETRERMRQSHLGEKHSPERVERRRQANLGNKHTLGRKQTLEHIEKRMQSHLGKKHSPERVEKMRQARWPLKRYEDATVALLKEEESEA